MDINKDCGTCCDRSKDLPRTMYHQEIFKTLMDAECKAYGETVDTIAQYHEGYVKGLEDFLTALEAKETVDEIAKEKQTQSKQWEKITDLFNELADTIIALKQI